MINVGIAGSFSTITRHTYALNKMQDIRITGRWITSGSKDNAVDMESGITCADPEIIIGKSDVMIITDAGVLGSRLAIIALRKARHVFLYPWVIHSINEAHQLIKLAREANVILKCGRTGKTGINGLLNAMPDIEAIGIIEFQHCIKISKSNNSIGISEVLLGDIEIVNSLVHARNISIKAKGLSLLSSQPEIINARLEFDNGCAVNYYCNRIASQNEYFIAIVLKDSILRYNFITNELTGWYLQHSINQNPIFIENFQVEKTDYLLDDLSVFFELIRSGPAFLSIYDNGFESFVLADRIHEKVLKTLAQYA
jgi:hypothetical protein